VVVPPLPPNSVVESPQAELNAKTTPQAMHETKSERIMPP